MNKQLEFDLWAEFTVSEYDVTRKNINLMDMARRGDVIMANPYRLEYTVRCRC